MVNISVSDGLSKKVDISLDSTSVSMISRFLHFMCFADHSVYADSECIKKRVSEFYDSYYDSSMLRDSRILKNILDYVCDNCF